MPEPARLHARGAVRRLLHAGGFLEDVADELLQGIEELPVARPLRPLRPHPRRSDQAGQHVPVEQGVHVLLELLAQARPVALVLGMGEQRRQQVDVLDVDPAAAAAEQVAAAVVEGQPWLDQAVLAVGGARPPLEVALEGAAGVVDDEALAALVVEVAADGGLEVARRVAPKRVRAQIEADAQQRGAARVDPARRAHLDLDLAVAEQRAAGEPLDALQQQHCRARAADRRQHQAQRGLRVTVDVDLERPLRAPEPLHQGNELGPLAQAVNLQAYRQ